MVFGVCEYCYEPFEGRENKVYCSRNCKVKAKDKRRQKALHEAGIVTPIEEIMRVHETVRPDIMYNNYEKGKLKARQAYMMKTFGLTLEQAAEMKAKHTNCDICGSTEPKGRDKTWHIDHCHKNGGIRGLLCNNCNVGIGMLKDDIEIMKKAIRYLEKFSQA